MLQYSQTPGLTLSIIFPLYNTTESKISIFSSFASFLCFMMRHRWQATHLPFSLSPTPQWLDSAIRQHRCIGRKKKFEHEWIHKLWTIICRTLDGVWGQMRVMNWGCSNGVQCCNPHIQSSQTFQVLVVWNKLCDLPNLAAPSKVTCHGQSASRLVCHEGSPCLLGWTLEHPAHTRVHIFSLLRTLRWKDKKKYQEIFNK